MTSDRQWPGRQLSVAERLIAPSVFALLFTAWSSSVAAQPAPTQPPAPDPPQPTQPGAGPPGYGPPPPGNGQPAGAVLYGPPPADPPTAHVHDGFYLRFGIGAGFMLGEAEESEFDESGKVTGFAVAWELALGGNIAKGLVLGGGIYQSLVSNPNYDLSFYDQGQLVRASRGGAISGTMVGPFLDWYFDATAGGHVQLALGRVSISAARGSDGNPFGTGGYPGQDSFGFGNGAMVGGGYELWVGGQFSLGVLGRLHHFSGELKCAEFWFCGPYGVNHLTANVFALLLTATYH